MGRLDCTNTLGKKGGATDVVSLCESSEDRARENWNIWSAVKKERGWRRREYMI